jgi:hypothetical protein
MPDYIQQITDYLTSIGYLISDVGFVLVIGLVVVGLMFLYMKYSPKKQEVSIRQPEFGLFPETEEANMYRGVERRRGPRATI